MIKITLKNVKEMINKINLINSENTAKFFVVEIKGKVNQIEGLEKKIYEEKPEVKLAKIIEVRLSNREILIENALIIKFRVGYNLAKKSFDLSLNPEITFSEEDFIIYEGGKSSNNKLGTSLVFMYCSEKRRKNYN